MTKITEGQVNTFTAGTFSYPEVNTCLTLTVVYGEKNTLAGAHFSKPLESTEKMNFPRPAEVIEKLKNVTGNLGTMTKAFVIGNRSVWTKEDAKPLYDFAKPASDELELEEIDTYEYKGVNIYVDFSGVISIKQSVAQSGSLEVKDGPTLKTTRWKD